jgi:hypothetical protein
MDGIFGGIEAKVSDWATLLAEYVSKETHVGVRINTIDNLSDYFNVSFLAKANLDDDKQRFAFALNLKVPIGDNHYSRKIIKQKETSVSPILTDIATYTPPKHEVETSVPPTGVAKQHFRTC